MPKSIDQHDERQSKNARPEVVIAFILAPFELGNKSREHDRAEPARIEGREQVHGILTISGAAVPSAAGDDETQRVSHDQADRTQSNHEPGSLWQG